MVHAPCHSIARWSHQPVTPPLLVVTPWYPTADRPYYGTFVRAWVDALVQTGQQPTVVHVDYVAGGTEHTITETSDDGIPKVHIAVPVPVDPTPVQIAQAYADALRPLMSDRWHDVRTIHAHVTFPMGWAVATTMAPGTRLVITEHTSKLDFYFRKDDTSKMYAETLERAAACLTVSSGVASMITAHTPDHLADRVIAVGNPVAFDQFALRPQQDNRLRRWLYLGNLVEGKGLRELIAGFARVKAGDPVPDAAPLHLTIVGDGPLRDELAALAIELEVADTVGFTDGVPPDRVPALLAEHDLLVHLSDAETFGMTAVEAAISGVPVLVTRCGGPEETLAHAAALGAVEFVPVKPSPSTVHVAYRRLLGRASTADWVTIRRLLEHRYSPAAVGGVLLHHLGLETGQQRSTPPPWQHTLAVTIDGAAERALKPMLEHLAAAGSTTTVVNIGDEAQLPRLIQAVQRVPVPPRGERLAKAAVRQSIRLWATRHPRDVAVLVHQIAVREQPDVMLVDEFVSATLATVKGELPPTVSVSQPATLWRHLSLLLGDDPRLTPLAGGKPQ
jgi:glycosyltransferase involved in cell wall biosynthesis